MIYRLGIFALLAGTTLAHAADNSAAPPSRTEDVLRTQYAAHTTPTAQRAEEAQRIYDAYLKSIGKPTRNPSSGYAGQTDTQAH
jgi:hypothetical protein